MPKDKIQDLRHHLFECLEMLKDGDLEIDRAKAICEVAQVIVNTAKVEIDFIKATESNKDTGFMRLENKQN
jgi:hypothetical protein